MVGDFVQDGVQDLLADAVGVAVTVALDGVLEDGDRFRVRTVEATIGGEGYTLVEAQQCVAFFCANAPEQLFVRLVFDLHMHVVHALLEPFGYGGERLLDECFKRRQSGLRVVYLLDGIFPILGMGFAVFSFEKAPVHAG